MKRYISIILILATMVGYAGETIKFRHITMTDGLSDNQINHITRDSQGFMWFSTAHGLNRYDGYSFKTFMHSNIDSDLPDIYIENVQEDASGMLWVRYSSTTYRCFDPKKEIFYDADKILADRYGITEKASLVFIDHNKDLWIHNDIKGTIHYSFAENKCLSDYVPTNGASTGYKVTGFGEDRQGVLRIYGNGYLDHINSESHLIDYENDRLVSVNDDTKYYSIYVDRDGDYWIWNLKGVKVFYPHEKRWDFMNADTTTPYRLSGNHVRSITNDQQGRVWIAIDHGGVNVIDKRSHTIQYLEHSEIDEYSLIQNSTYCLYADINGGMWVGTFKRGISYYNDNLFKLHTNHFPEFYNIHGFIPDVSSIAENNNGDICLGVTNGIITIDHATRQSRHLPIPASITSFPHDVITCILADDNGKLWMGTYQSGLITYDKGNFSRHVLDTKNKDSRANKTIYSLARDTSGTIWIGTWGNGLWSYDPISKKITPCRNKDGIFTNEYIASICLSKDGNTYMATPYYVDVYHPATRRLEKITGNRRGDTKFANPQMSQVYEDSRGLLWLSTTKGLSIYDRRSDVIENPATLLNLNICGVTEDNDKTIWVSTTNGIYHIIVSSNGNSYNYDIQHYCDLNRINNQQFNLRAITKLSNGKIIMGGSGGISTLDPANPKYDTTAYKVRFTGLSLFNRNVMIDSLYQGNRILSQALSYTDKINLDYGQNIFSVTFSAMNYSRLEKTVYMYMLDGFDSNWTYTTNNKITYTNLGPGTYSLKVKTLSDDGFPSDDTAELKIVIAPPFYRSWMAYIIYLLLLVGVVFLIRSYMRHNEEQKYKLLQVEQEAAQRQEIDNMKLRFFTNISHDLRTPLTLILTPLEYVMERIDNTDFRDKLTIAHNNALRLLDMVNQLLDFRKSDMTGHTLSAAGGDIVETIRTQCNNFAGYSEQRNINLTFFSPVKKLYMVFDEDKINKILMNLLSNAFKFTPEGGRVDVSLDIIPGSEDTQEMLEIKVADNGCGISDEHKAMIFERFYQVPRKDSRIASGSGVGLNLVKEFVTLHDGTIEVHDNIGKGTVFVVKIPVTRVSADESDCTAAEPAETVAIQVSDSSQPNDNELGNNNLGGNNTRPSILLVDDNDDFRMFMKDCLKHDYNIYEAADGAEAWKILPELQPDIIVSDVMMPEMDGNELCRHVKTDIRTSHILVILLTARAAKEHEQKGLEVGADDYITKPFNLNILTLRIKNLLQRRRDSHNKPMDVSPSKINITSLDEKLINKAIRYVEDNLSRSDLSVEELSGELGMSRVHLYKKLLSITGKTPIEFIRILRLKRAAQMLRESQLSIAEITYQTGFNNLNLFRKYFKAEFGMLPSEYQAKHSEKYSGPHDNM